MTTAGHFSYLRSIVLTLVLSLLLFQQSSFTSEASSPPYRAIQLINGYRVSMGLLPLEINDILMESAQDHTNDMHRYRYVSHAFHDGTWYYDYAVSLGWTRGWWLTEVIAGSATPYFKTAEDVVAAWQGSPGHNKALITPSYNVIGCGKAAGYWSCYLGRMGN